MVFSSLLFLFRFLPIILAVYYAAPRRFRNGVLFIGSLIFYGWGEPVYMGLLLLSTAVDYVHGLLVHRWKDQGRMRAARLVVAASVCINLGLLGLFKYGDFFIGLAGKALHLSPAFLKLSLPIGISFYTFQTMSYTIDIYRGEAKPQKSFIDFGAYVSMFPQLIAGPIVRYHTIAEQLAARKADYAWFSHGVKLFICGLGKKVLLANNMGVLWNEISGISQKSRSGLLVWLGITAFGFQIYFDFSGYSDMAMGLGAMFGFAFPENFRYPYTSKSITEFWRRWHISLGTWFKEYVYIPLGGNRKGILLQIRNILIVWLLTGIWHGAAWNYLLWGLYFGVLLLLEKLVLNKYLERLPGIIRNMYAMALVFSGWVLFAHEDLQAGMLWLKQMFLLEGTAVSDSRAVYLLLSWLPLFLAAGIGATSLPARLSRKLSGGTKTLAEVLFVAAVFLLSVAYLVDQSYNPFLYFRF